MSSVDSLLHITFQTGHCVSTRRHDVAPAFLGQLVRLVGECEKTSCVEMPTPSGLMVLRRVSVSKKPAHVACWSLSRPDGPALITQALSLRKDEGDALWRTLHSSLGGVQPKFATQADSPPTEPWLGVALHLPLLMEGSMEGGPLEWLGDFERCVAWAWIDGGFAADGR